MKIGNKLFLVLFNSKQEYKWESWKRFAIKNNYLFSTLSDPAERPVMRGQLGDKPVSIEAIYDSNPDNGMSLKIKTQIHNPTDLYLLIQDKKAYKSKTGIFNKSIHGIAGDRKIEDKFLIKSNSERYPFQILKNQELSNDLYSQNNFSIEVIDYELILTSYTTIEINKEFIELLKLFYSFLITYEEISLATMINRK